MNNQSTHKKYSLGWHFLPLFTAILIVVGLYLYLDGFFDDGGISIGIFAVGILITIFLLMTFRWLSTVWVDPSGVKLWNGRFIPISEIHFEQSELRESLCTINKEDLEIGTWQIGRKNWEEMMDILRSGRGHNNEI